MGGLRCAFSLAAENGAALLVLHVASEFQAWETADEAGFSSAKVYTWEVDRIIREATLDLNGFLEKNRDELAWVRTVKKRVVLGEVVEKIVEVALQEEVDLIVMAKRRRSTLSRLISRSISEAISREAPCPVLSICPAQVIHGPWRGRQVPVTGRVLQGSET
jgi:nucleotide-binding universal stress UspA family protein